MAAALWSAACRDDGGAASDGANTSSTSESTEDADATSAATAWSSGDSSDSGGPAMPLPPGSARELYPDAVALQALAIDATCSLNNGVCHNNNNYPDLHTINNVLSTVMAPCGVEVATPELIFDECEAVGDRLVIASVGLDAEIMEVTLDRPDAPTAFDLNAARFRVGGDPSAIAYGTADIVVTRGEQTFDLGSAGVIVSSVTDDTMELSLIGADAAKPFVDNRSLPWTPNHVRAADPNGNGIAGGATAIPLISPGSPWQSYIFLRLVDENYGDLMPRQCRTWDDRATYALGCWIEGLKASDNGEVENSFDPIDYDSCTVEVEGLGRCETILGSDLESIEGIVSARCGGNDCHVGAPPHAQGLDLSPGRLREALVDVTSETTGLPLVVPGDPAASYLLCKLDPQCADIEGAVMPSQGELLPEELAAISAWIAAGATDD